VFGLVAVAYLLGSVPTSVWLGRLLHGVDLRTLGSGNAGGTNALRVLGWRVGLPVMAVDVGKGALATALPTLAGVGDPAWLPLACAVAAVVGHVFPVFARFRGGKGVATGAGALLVLAPLAALGCAAIWGATVAVTRLVSLASVLAALALPVAVGLLGGSAPRGLLALSVGLALFVVWTHRSNLRRLLRGEEKPITVGRAGEPPTGDADR
jgi:glycerol-3-phosphate acyltransferase PlsY